jgi:hypothetical protein
MGTWDVGPFDNDTAADFGGDLDEVAAGEREGIVRSALTRVIDTAAYLEAPESEVAAAALVAAQCPGGEPADPIYGPEEPLPDLHWPARSRPSGPRPHHDRTARTD